MVKKLDDVLNALSANRQEKIEQRQIELAQEAINHYEKTGLHVSLSDMKAWLKAKKHHATVISEYQATVIPAQAGIHRLNE